MPEMEQNEGVQFYLRFLNERTAAVRSALEQLLIALPGSDHNSKMQRASASVTALEALNAGLSDSDIPPWSKQLLHWLRMFIQRPDQSNVALSLMKTIIETYEPLLRHQWNSSRPAASGIDFEAVYKKYAEQSRLQELFDDIAAHLVAIAESGQVDSMRVLNALEAVVETLKRNARGSYFSTQGAWRFTTAVFHNFLWEALSDIPGLGAAVRALRSAFEELDQEMSDLDQNISREIGALATSEVPALSPGPKLLLEVGQSPEDNSEVGG